MRRRVQHEYTGRYGTQTDYGTAVDGSDTIDVTYDDGTRNKHAHADDFTYAQEVTAGPDEDEYEVVVVISVRATTRENAARQVCDALTVGGRADLFAANENVEEFVLPEAWAKPIDGNDRPAMHLVPDDPQDQE